MRQALKVYYDGGSFFGSQRQPDRRTVEGELLNALGELKIEVKDFKSACRTDRGVSALGNVFALTCDSKLIPGAINSKLPGDIRVLAAREVDDRFNPRYEALARTYRYFLPDEGYSISRIKKAARVFKGEHSFHNFAILEGRSPVRIIKNIEVKKVGSFFIFTISGESFLWQMIRRMASAFKMVGAGQMDPGDIERLLDPENLSKIPPSPPENLVLWAVEYPFEFEHEAYSAERLRKDILKKQIEANKDALISELLLEEL
ncbi:MAG: tRNA pseudouridine(38-40) synthase TruA [Candidatus Hydrothermarchaeaceae archaeon]